MICKANNQKDWSPLDTYTTLSRASAAWHSGLWYKSRVIMLDSSEASEPQNRSY